MNLNEQALRAASDAVARSPVKAVYERADDIARVAVTAYVAAEWVRHRVCRRKDDRGRCLAPSCNCPLRVGGIAGDVLDGSYDGPCG